MQVSYVIGASQDCPCQVYTEFDVDHLDVARFQQAVQHVVDRHPMLHAVIVDGTQQRIRTASERRPPLHLIVDQTPDLDARRRACMTAFKARPELHWDLQLSALSATTVRLHLVLDMLFIDATSAMQLCHEVSEHYRRLVGQGTVTAPVDGAFAFRDYCDQLDTKQASAASLEYWTARCATIPGPPQLPCLKKTGGQDVDFQRESITLGAEHWTTLKGCAGELKVTPNAILLAAFSEVLRLYGEEPDFSVTVTMSERPVSRGRDFTGVVGEFTNILLCPVHGGHGDSLAERARAIHHELSEGLEYSDVSGLEVTRMLRKHRADPHLAFPIVFTSFLGIVRSDLELAGCQTRLHYQQTQTPQVTLDHQVYELNGELQSNWDYDATIFGPELIRDMLSCFRSLLERVAADNLRAATLPPEVLHLRRGMNRTDRTFDADAPRL
ncbi:MAG TPA: condensation domain-containing protein, partial [Kofleriaceae bacterium]|nr:condensation domain-containing protein [Kofleriaceae bacterium]